MGKQRWYIHLVVMEKNACSPRGDLLQSPKGSSQERADLQLEAGQLQERQAHSKEERLSHRSCGVVLESDEVAQADRRRNPK